MRIGIDLFSIDKPGENYGVGVGVYVWKILPELFKLGHDHQFVVFANKDNEGMIPRCDNVTIIVSPFSNKFRFLRVFHEQFYLPLLFIKNKLCFIHFVGINISLPLASKSVLTVYDLMWKYYYDKGDRHPKFIYYRLIVPVSLKKVKSLITISHFIAEEIKTTYSRRSNIYPIHLGPGDHKEPSIDENSQYSLRYNYPYIYTVTTSMPHKNLKVLLHAFLKIKQTYKADLKLVISGQLKGNFHKETEIFRDGNGLQNDIILTGFIPESEKTFCYRHALMFVFPSFYEGFGLPILEAMALKVPVIAANTASLPEVGGDACIYFNPKSVADLVLKISSLLDSSGKRDELIERGVLREKKFTWGKTAHETLQVYQKVFGK